MTDKKLIKELSEEERFKILGDRVRAHLFSLLGKGHTEAFNIDKATELIVDFIRVNKRTLKINEFKEILNEARK